MALYFLRGLFVTKEFKVYTWQDIILGKFPSLQELRKAGFIGTSISVGAFDGVHLGHKALIDSVVSFKDCFSGVVTFSSNPRSVFFPDDYSGDLTSLQQKLSLFKEKQLGFAVVIDFSSEFGKMEGNEFLSVLKDKLSVAYIAEGQDFRCGYKGRTDMIALKAFFQNRGVTVETLSSVIVKEQRVSSSAIRKSVLKGDFATVKQLLGRNYSLDCSQFLLQYQQDQGIYLLHTNKEGKSFQVLPPDGKYNISLCVNQNKKRVFYSAQGELQNGSLKIVLAQKDLYSQGLLESVEFTE